MANENGVRVATGYVDVRPRINRAALDTFQQRLVREFDRTGLKAGESFAVAFTKAADRARISLTGEMGRATEQAATGGRRAGEAFARGMTQAAQPGMARLNRTLATGNSRMVAEQRAVGRRAGDALASGLESGASEGAAGVNRRMATANGRLAAQQRAAGRRAGSAMADGMHDAAATGSRRIAGAMGEGNARVTAQQRLAGGRAGRAMGTAAAEGVSESRGRVTEAAGASGTAAGAAMGRGFRTASSTGLRAANANVSENLRRMEDRWVLAGGRISTAGQMLTHNVTLPMTALAAGAAVLGVKYADAMNTAQKRMMSMDVSAKDSAKSLTELNNYAIKTPYSFEGMAKAASNLIATGKSAGEATSQVKLFSDMAAANGVTSVEKYNRALIAFTQISGSAKLYTQDIKQLNEAGIPIWSQLRKATGMNNEELTKALKLGKIQTKDVLPELIDGWKRYEGQGKKAATSISGAFDNMVEQVSSASGKMFGQFDEKSGKFKYTKFGKSLIDLTDAIGDLAKSALPVFGDALSLVLPPLTGFVKLLTKLADLLKGDGWLQKGMKVLLGVALVLGPTLVVLGGALRLGAGAMSAFRLITYTANGELRAFSQLIVGAWRLIPKFASGLNSMRKGDGFMAGWRNRRDQQQERDANRPGRADTRRVNSQLNQTREAARETDRAVDRIVERISLLNRENLEPVEREFESLHRQVTGVSTAVEAISRHLRDLANDNLNQVTGEFRELSRHAGSTSSSVDRVDRAIRGLSNDNLNQVSGEFKQLRSAASRARGMADSTSRAVHGLANDNLNHIQAEFSTLRSRANSARTAISRVSSAAHRLANDNLNGVQREFSTLTSRANNSRQAVNRVTSAVRNLSNERLNKVQAEFSDLRSRANRASSAVGTSKSGLNSRIRAVGRLSLNHVQGEFTGLTSRIDKARRAANRLDNAIDDVNDSTRSSGSGGSHRKRGKGLRSKGSGYRNTGTFYGGTGGGATGGGGSGGMARSARAAVGARAGRHGGGGGGGGGLASLFGLDGFEELRRIMDISSLGRAGLAGIRMDESSVGLGAMGRNIRGWVNDKAEWAGSAFSNYPERMTDWVTGRMPRMLTRTRIPIAALAGAVMNLIGPQLGDYFMKDVYHGSGNIAQRGVNFGKDVFSMKTVEGAVGNLWSFLKDLKDTVVDTWELLKKYWSHPDDLLPDMAQQVASMMGDYVQTFVDSWSTFMDFMNDPSQFAQDVISSVISGLKDAMPNFNGLFDFSTGVHFADGGIVPGGYKPGKDSVPAVLAPGEGVLRPEVVRALGPNLIATMNAAGKGGNLDKLWEQILAALAGVQQAQTGGAPTGGSTGQQAVPGAQAPAAPGAGTGVGNLTVEKLNQLGAAVRRFAFQDSAPAWQKVSADVRLAWTASLKPSLDGMHREVASTLPVSLNKLRATNTAVWNGVSANTQSSWAGRVRPALSSMRSYLTGTLANAERSFQSTHRSAWNSNAAYLQSTYAGRIRPTMSAMGSYMTGTLSSRERTFRNTNRSVWNSVASEVSSESNRSISSMGRLNTAVIKLQSRFAASGASIKSSWRSAMSYVNSSTRSTLNGPYNRGAVRMMAQMAKIAGDKAPLRALHFATGGVVPGYAPGVDNVPAVLSPGEGILRPEVVRQLGHDTIKEWNANAKRKGRAFADGGVVGPIRTSAKDGAAWTEKNKMKPWSGYAEAIGHGWKAVIAPALKEIKNHFKVSGRINADMFAKTQAQMKAKGKYWDDHAGYAATGSAKRAIAIERARSHGGGSWYNLCEKNVETAWGMHALYPSARAAANAVPSKHSTGGGKHIPPGAPIYWPGIGGGYGHIAIADTTPGYIWSNDVKRRGFIDRVPFTAISKGWGAGNGFWSPSVGSHRVNVKGGGGGDGKHFNPWPGSQIDDSGGGVIPYTGGGGHHASPAKARGIGLAMLKSIGKANQFSALKTIWNHESGWRWNAKNPSSGAYGIPQSLPASKMRSAGKDWKDNAATQIQWGLGYMNGRYGGPNAAWRFWQSHHWYKNGGLVTSPTRGIVGEAGPELIVPMDNYKRAQQLLEQAGLQQKQGHTVHLHAAPDVPSEQAVLRSLQHLDMLYG